MMMTTIFHIPSSPPFFSGQDPPFFSLVSIYRSTINLAAVENKKPLH